MSNYLKSIWGDDKARYLGPYVVVKRTNRGVYILKEVDGAEHAEHYAAFRLLPYISRKDPKLFRLQNDSEPSNSEQDDLDLPDDSDHQSDVTDLDTDVDMISPNEF
jgi:hypothetical protein